MPKIAFFGAILGILPRSPYGKTKALAIWPGLLLHSLLALRLGLGFPVSATSVGIDLATMRADGVNFDFGDLPLFPAEALRFQVGIGNQARDEIGGCRIVATNGFGQHFSQQPAQVGLLGMATQRRPQDDRHNGQVAIVQRNGIFLAILVESNEPTELIEPAGIVS